jgi:amino acid adenylation domain-containing protein
MATDRPERPRFVPYLLPQLLSESARIRPDGEAVRCRGRSLTYAELERASNRLARTLIDRGVRRGDRVGVFVPKTAEVVAALYGIMKAGAVYVPLDPTGPVPRASLVARDCAISALVSTPSRAAALLPTLGDQDVRLTVLVDAGEATADPPGPSMRFEEAVGPRVDPSDPGVPVVESDLAYILYTSGSTGVPKGVMVTHRNALTFVEWCATKIGVGPEDRLSSHAPFHFDLSVFDLYLAALGGATVVLVPEEQAYFGSSLVDFVRDERITVWYSVPSALMLITRAVTDPSAVSTLRTVVFAGEVYPTKQLRELRELLGDGIDLWNLYGPTETNVCTYYRVKAVPADERTIPIGRACENTDAFAVTERGAMAGPGEEGELVVRGPGVMKGYWGQPEKTAERLVQGPLQPGFRDWIYRTGDLVRVREDGDLDFLGRRDHQIKSRGYRIELGEVEAAVNSHPDLQEAAAVAVPHEEWGTAIVAWVVPKRGATVTGNQVKRHVAHRLPRYMVPAVVTVTPALPRTPNGKVDRLALSLRDPAPRSPDGRATDGFGESVGIRQNRVTSDRKRQ